MTGTTLNCPNCGHPIAISEALAAQVRAEVEAEARTREAERIRAAAAQAEARAREQAAAELALLREQLAEQQQKAREAQAAELALRKEKAALEERQRELDLEVARRLEAEKQRLEEAIRRAASEEQALKLREKDKQIEDLKKLLDEAKRKSEQGSQERQGEALEIDIEAMLKTRFPLDDIRPVKKGARGADVVQIVRNESLAECGAIVWEAKNAKHWQPAWIAKLKDDQREAGAALAVLVATSLPEGIRGFGLVEGVWVADLASYPALAAVLRAQLVEVARARAVASGVGAKMEALYAYLTGHEFRQRVEAIVEGFVAMQQQLERERRAMERQWAEREKQLERVVQNTVRMYGEIRGVVGASLPEIPALSLEEGSELPSPAASLPPNSERRP